MKNKQNNKQTRTECTPLLLSGMDRNLKETIKSNLTSCEVAMRLN